MYGLANKRSYFSRGDDEIYQALSSASRKVYLWTAREFRGYFFKTDTVTITLVPNVQEYACPLDLSILIKIGEQPVNSPPNTPWNWMRPADVNSDRFILREFESLVLNPFTPNSQFVYYGPYLPQSSAILAKGANPQGPKKLRFAPIPFDNRNVNLYYAAAFLEIVNAQSVLMIPSEFHDCILDFASAELVRLNGDAMAATFEEAGQDKFQHDALPFYRQQQSQQVPLTQEPYLDDLS
jgi:hypothetical protein